MAIDPAGSFEAWEAELAASELVDDPVELQMDAKTYRSDLLRRAGMLGNNITAACVQLELHNGRQFHQLPYHGKELKVLAEYEHDKHGRPSGLRLTSNIVTEIKVGLRDVFVEDFRFIVSTIGIAMRSGSRLQKGAPTDSPAGALPMIWRSKGGEMHRFFGTGYALGHIPMAMERLKKNVQIEDRFNDIQRLFSICNLLSREVSLEAEYPYPKDLK